MRIAINGRVLIKNQLEGIGYFTREVLRNLIELYPQHDYLVLFDCPPAEEFLFPGVEYRVLRPAARHPLLYHFWFEVLVPYYLRGWDAEMFLSFDGFTSRHLKIPVVTAIHDLAYAHFPEMMKSRELGFYTKYQPQFALSSAAILTVSEYSKNDIHEKYSIDLDDIYTVYNGSRFEKNPPEPEPEILSALDLQEGKYFLYTGSLHPRKNIVRLVKAFEKFSEGSSEEYKLVLAGRDAWKTQELHQAIDQSPVKNNIVRSGYLSDQELWTLLIRAKALCYISLFEGFGVPVLDALHAGIPVIGSRSTSIPEVAGDAGLLVNPENVSEIAGAMKKIVDDKDLCDQLIREGALQKLKFSWSSTTRRIYEVVSEVYDRHYEGMIG